MFEEIFWKYLVFYIVPKVPFSDFIVFHSHKVKKYVFLKYIFLFENQTFSHLFLYFVLKIQFQSCK